MRTVELICRRDGCPSHFDAEGWGHFHHWMLSRVGDKGPICPACSGSAVEPQRQGMEGQRFALGNLTMTHGFRACVMDRLDCEPSPFAVALLERHCTGDWGLVPAGDAQVNRLAIEQDERALDGRMMDPAERRRVLSAYKLRDKRIWVITEAGRHETTLLLPEEY
jgi:hypothetical protein